MAETRFTQHFKGKRNARVAVSKPLDSTIYWPST